MTAEAYLAAQREAASGRFRQARKRCMAHFGLGPSAPTIARNVWPLLAVAGVTGIAVWVGSRCARRASSKLATDSSCTTLDETRQHALTDRSLLQTSLSALLTTAGHSFGSTIAASIITGVSGALRESTQLKQSN